MTKKRTRPAKKEKEAPDVTTAQAKKILMAERKQRVAVVQAGIQALLKEQNCALDMEIVVNGSGVKVSHISIIPLANQES